MTLEIVALIVSSASLSISIFTTILAIKAINQAKVIQKETRRESKEQLDFITHLIVNSAADPNTVQRMLDDFNNVGEWRAKVFKGDDGKYNLKYKVAVGDGEIKPTGRLFHRPSKPKSR